MSDFEYDIPELYQNNLGMNSRNMYLNEIRQYPLLSDEEEKTYSKMLNKNNKALLVFDDINGCVKPNLNTDLLFYSLTNCSSTSIIDNLIDFYDGLDNSSDKVIDILKKYQNESNKIGRTLNINELSSIFNIRYIKETKQLSEKELLHEVKEFMNYKLAFKKMFESNLRLVVSVAAKFKSKIDIMDLIAEGNLGLMKAIVGFDSSLGYKFSTYATACIKQNIKRYIYNHNMSVRIPECVGSDLSIFKRKLEKLEQEEGRALQLDEIAEKLDLPVDLVRRYLLLVIGEVSLDEFISEDDSLKLGDTIPSNDNVEEEVMAEFLKDDILDFLDVLNDRQQDVIKMKFGLGEYNGVTYSMRDIAKKHSISPQRVAEMFYRALYLMKRSAKTRGKQKSLSDYYFNQ